MLKIKKLMVNGTLVLMGRNTISENTISIYIHLCMKTIFWNCDKWDIIMLSLLIFYAFKDEGILVIPTVADPPPKLGGKEILSEDYQSRAFSLLSIASISGCCQVKFSP